MKLFERSGTKGISFGFFENGPPRLKPSRNANQEKPRRFYVYGHFDKQGIPFYIGKGTKRRAWEKALHPAYFRFSGGKWIEGADGSLRFKSINNLTKQKSIQIIKINLYIFNNFWVLDLWQESTRNGKVRFIGISIPYLPCHESYRRWSEEMLNLGTWRFVAETKFDFGPLRD